MRGGWLLLFLSLGACDNRVLCDSSSELRYQGRPPSRLFAYDTSCRKDCFSQPLVDSCNTSCDAAVSTEPLGGVRGDPLTAQTPQARDDRVLVLADVIDDDARALVLEFGFIDEAGGQAPAGYGLLLETRSYLHDEVRGTARFRMQAGVAIDTNHDGFYDLSENSPEVKAAGSEVLEARSGRLDILNVDDNTLSGKFFLAFNSATNQPQGSMHGCFDMSLGERVTNYLLRPFTP